MVQLSMALTRTLQGVYTSYGPVAGDTDTDGEF